MQHKIGLTLSDLHFGQKRVNETDDSAIKFYRQLAVTYQTQLQATLEQFNQEPTHYHIFLLGDIVEGEKIFHSQAYESQPMHFQMYLAEEFFDHLFDWIGDTPADIWMVRGNHGRVGKENAVENNYDTMLYLKLEATHARTRKLAFHNTFNDWLLCGIGEWKFLIHHGHGIRMYMSIPDYGIRHRMVHWSTIFGNYDVTMLGHFHHTKYFQFNRMTCLLNGCARWNDFTVMRMGLEPTPAQWVFGIGEDRAVTWKDDISLSEADHLPSPDLGVSQVIRGSDSERSS